MFLWIALFFCFCQLTSCHVICWFIHFASCASSESWTTWFRRPVDRWNVNKIRPMMSSAALNIQIGARPVDPTVADSIFNIFGRQKATGPKRREMLIFRRFFFLHVQLSICAQETWKLGNKWRLREWTIQVFVNVNSCRSGIGQRTVICSTPSVRFGEAAGTASDWKFFPRGRRK